MMENNSTPSPDPVPESAPITVPVPAESAVTPPPAPPAIPLRERPNAPLLHKGFQNLFRLGIANIVINLLNNTFKLGDKIPSLGVVLSVVSLAVSILTLIVLWKLSAAVPRFRSVVYLNLFPLLLFPFAALVGLSSLQERIPKLEKFKGQSIIIVDESGKESDKAASILKKEWFSQINILRGGMSSWMSEGLPVTK